MVIQLKTINVKDNSWPCSPHTIMDNSLSNLLLVCLLHRTNNLFLFFFLQGMPIPKLPGKKDKEQGKLTAGLPFKAPLGVVQGSIPGLLIMVPSKFPT